MAYRTKEECEKTEGRRKTKKSKEEKLKEGKEGRKEGRKEKREESRKEGRQKCEELSFNSELKRHKNPQRNA